MSGVSVIVPHFRALDTLPRALASVAHQTRRVSEVIVVDDASGPEVVAELSRMLEQWPDLPVKLKTLATNAGAASARNAGWAYADQEYIAFLDSDDAWHPCKIEVQLSYLEQHPEVDVCGHNYAVAPAGQQHPEASPVDLSARVSRIGSFSMLVRNPFVTPSVMVRRGIPHRFLDGQRHMEDHLLWMRMALGNLKVVRLEVPLVTLYKRVIGVGGLSAQTLNMQRADMRNYRLLKSEGLLSSSAEKLLLIWSLVKFARRLLLLAGWQVAAAWHAVRKPQA